MFGSRGGFLEGGDFAEVLVIYLSTPRQRLAKAGHGAINCKVVVRHAQLPRHPKSFYHGIDKSTPSGLLLA